MHNTCGEDAQKPHSEIHQTCAEKKRNRLGTTKAVHLTHLHLKICLEKPSGFQLYMLKFLYWHAFRHSNTKRKPHLGKGNLLNQLPQASEGVQVDLDHVCKNRKPTQWENACKTVAEHKNSGNNPPNNLSEIRNYCPTTSQRLTWSEFLSAVGSNN